jgi:hypothetical protein
MWRKLGKWLLRTVVRELLDELERERFDDAIRK